MARVENARGDRTWREIAWGHLVTGCDNYTEKIGECEQSMALSLTRQALTQLHAIFFLHGDSIVSKVCKGYF